MLLKKHVAVASAFVVAVAVVLGLQICEAAGINRESFPKGFVFGTATSAYQVEGAWKEDGRGPSIWDTYAHMPGVIQDNSTGDDGVDQYHRYEEDIKLMKEMGVDAYRFSISWTRIFPNGTGEVNQAGVDYYTNVLNALRNNGIEPYVTIHHWDFPQALEDQYGGWFNSQSVKDFTRFAETCFERFGDRVKYWITFNEPFQIITQVYDVALKTRKPCEAGAPSTGPQQCQVINPIPEPYIATHNILLAHAAATDIYNKYYKSKQNGTIGMTIDSSFYEPLTDSEQDKQAAEVALDFHLGWYLDPLIYGDYPKSMRERVGDRLPKFTQEESNLLKASCDFVGINHYTTSYATNEPSIKTNYPTATLVNGTITDSGLKITAFKDGKPIGERANAKWLFIVPRGIRGLMKHIKEKYGNPAVIITENGMDDANNSTISLQDALKDETRIKYINDYLENLLAAIKDDGCNVKGYFVWSLLDNWEWQTGYSSRFGMYFVDYKDGLKRYAKDSVKWFTDFLKSSQVSLTN